jgi:hypothetical protein
VKPPFGVPAGTQPCPERLATTGSESCVVPGVTPTAKRRQRACGPCDGASKTNSRGADVMNCAEGNTACAAMPGTPAHRGLRAGHVRIGDSPGTWETSASLREHCRPGVRLRKLPRQVRSAHRPCQVQWAHPEYCEVKETKRRGMGVEESERVMVPTKMGNRSRRDPLEGRTRR